MDWLAEFTGFDVRPYLEAALAWAEPALAPLRNVESMAGLEGYDGAIAGPIAALALAIVIILLVRWLLRLVWRTVAAVFRFARNRLVGPQAAVPAPPPPAEPVKVPPPDLLEIEDLIKSYVIASMAVGVLPLPLFDVVALVGLQVVMTERLCRRYGVAFSRQLAQTAAFSVIGAVFPVALGIGLASTVKFVPGLGSLVGSAGTSILAGAATYALGRILAQHLESGGTLLDFNPNRLRQRLMDEFRRGQQVAREARSQESKAA